MLEEEFVKSKVVGGYDISKQTLHGLTVEQ
jgi:hypothetical protein